MYVMSCDTSRVAPEVTKAELSRSAEALQAITHAVFQSRSSIAAHLYRDSRSLLGIIPSTLGSSRSCTRISHALSGPY